VDNRCTVVPCRKEDSDAHGQRTGEFFTDLSDFRQQLEKIVKNADVEGYYQPRKHLLENYGDQISGKILLRFVQDNFGHRLMLPEEIQLLLPGSFS
jgi:hypothetical protein